MSEQSREQFEAWACRADNGRLKKGPFRGDYSNPVMQKMWAAWQASRQAIEVELPEKFEPDIEIGESFDFGFDRAIDECLEAIESCGLRVKA